MEAISVYIVAADAAQAERIARALVEDRLAACVNVMAPVSSVYRWKGQIETASEIVLIAKSRRDLFDRLAARVRDLHSYEIPAVVAWPIVAGDGAYLDWIAAETS